ncbi:MULTISPECIES: DMT family transporter [unclassified Marinomonas]|uniref:DMT family transporter n=1 Tax=unclassified Marinomonas TaxID=196814 RepID=UPI000AEF07DE|nr:MULTISPECIES: DMT family transporter [unclassified Marinomonas]
MIAIIWMTGSLVSFCLMAVAARELAGELSIFQALFFRSAIGLICLSVIYLALKEKPQLSTNRLKLHSLRNFVHFAGQYGWFMGISLLPLANVFALEFTVPVWTALIAAFFLKETLTQKKIIAICLGLMGVLIIVKPGYGIFELASLIVIGAAMCYAVAYTTTKALMTTEAPFSILFYMCLLQIPIGFIGSIDHWVWPEGAQWIWLSLIGMTALTAHYCITKAMGHAEVTVIVTLDFLRLPLVALIGVFLYQEAFELSLILGAGVMLLGNLVNTQRKAKT